MQKICLNQRYIPAWDTDLSDAYIKKSYFAYQNKWKKWHTFYDGTIFGPHQFGYPYSTAQYHYTGEQVDWQLINFLYLEGRIRKVLACDYDQFAERMIKGFPRRISFWKYRHVNAPFRQKHQQIKWKEKGKKHFLLKNKLEEIGESINK